MTSPTAALELTGVSKGFAAPGRPTVDALDRIDLRLARGSITGLFGPNGAGKTTLLRICAGLVEPDAGELRVLGRAVRGIGAWQRAIGWCPAEDRSFYPRLSARENLRLHAALAGLARAQADARIGELARGFGLEALLDRPFQAFSAGERQRLNLARALLHRPPVLLLDEPLRSTDPRAAAALVEALRAHVAAGGAVLWTGHELRGLEPLCDRIEILQRGRLVLSGPAAEILARAAEPGWELTFRTGAERERALARAPALARGPSDELALLAGAPGSESAELAALLGRPDAGVVRAERRERISLAELVARVAAGEVPPRHGGEPPVSRAPAAASPAAVRAVAAGGAGGAAHADSFGRARLIGRAARALGALARRDRQIFFSYRAQVALRLALALVWASLFACLSLLVGEGSPRAVADLRGDYFTYALLGICFLRLSHAAMVHLAHALREEQLQGTLEPLHATGRSPLLLLAGSLVWPVASELVAMVFMVGAGAALFGADLSRADVPALALASAVTLAALALLGVLSSAFVMAFKRGDPVAALFNLAAILLSGVFFPVAMLPEWLRPLSAILPLTWGLEAVRAAALGGQGLESADYRAALLRLGALALALVPLALLGYRRAVLLARRRGSLGHA